MKNPFAASQEGIQSGLGDIFSNHRDLTDFDSCIYNLALLMKWLGGPVISRDVRLRFLLQSLERNSEWKKRLALWLQSILNEGPVVRLLCQAGLGEESGFFGELFGRIGKQLVDLSEGDRDLAEHYIQLIPDEDCALWIKEAWPQISPLIKELLAIKDDLCPGTDWGKLDNELRLSIMILSAEIASIGVTKVVRTRLPQNIADDFPFLSLNREVSGALGLKKVSDLRKAEGIYNKLSVWINQSKDAVEVAQESIALQGVSMKLVYKLEILRALINRIEMLLGMLFLPDSERAVILPELLSRLSHDQLASNNLIGFVLEHVRVISTKIVEHVADRGENYIVQDGKNLAILFASALGGGAVAGVMAAFKVGAHGLNWPLVIDWTMIFLIYFLGLSIMQWLGLTLATKQPSYTATAFSSKLAQARKDGDAHLVAREIYDVIKSQASATFGNLLMAIPTALIVDWGINKLSGQHIMQTHEAVSTIAKIHPFASMSLFWAALTGVFLWISGIISGQAHNWCVYNRIPNLMEQRIQRRGIATVSAHKLASKLPALMGAVAGNFSLAFFLTSTPALGHILGIPLDIKHVTLSTASVTLALTADKGALLNSSSFWWSLSGLFLVGAMNFGVSFFLAMEVALQAEGLNRRWMKTVLWSALVKRKKAN